MHPSHTPVYDAEQVLKLVIHIFVNMVVALYESQND